MFVGTMKCIVTSQAITRLSNFTAVINHTLKKTYCSVQACETPDACFFRMAKPAISLSFFLVFLNTLFLG